MIESMELLPTEVTAEMNPYLMRLVRAYHTTPIPSRHELLLNQYEMPVVDGWCNIKDIANEEIVS